RPLYDLGELTIDAYDVLPDTRELAARCAATAAVARRFALVERWLTARLPAAETAPPPRSRLSPQLRPAGHHPRGRRPVTVSPLPPRSLGGRHRSSAAAAIFAWACCARKPGSPWHAWSRASASRSASARRRTHGSSASVTSSTGSPSRTSA